MVGSKPVHKKEDRWAAAEAEISVAMQNVCFGKSHVFLSKALSTPAKRPVCRAAARINRRLTQRFVMAALTVDLCLRQLHGKIGNLGKKLRRAFWAQWKNRSASTKPCSQSISRQVKGTMRYGKATHFEGLGRNEGL
jgi:hypothetical protein